MLKKWSLCLLTLLLSAVVACAQDVPKPQGWVNDFAKVITPDYSQKLTTLIQELEEKTSSEIAVVTIDSIAPYDEKEYARVLFDNWKPGKKGKDNGILILLTIKERRWRIETGYGVEGILPDGLCGEIGRNYMVPYFKEKEYGEGLYHGAAQIAKIIADNNHVNLSNLDISIPPQVKSGTTTSGTGDAGLIIIFIIFVALMILSNFSGGYYGGYGSSGGGFGGGGFGGGGFGGFGGGGGGGGGAGGGF